MTKRDNLLVQIGNTIKNARLSGNISAESLANTAKISRATLWSIEKGMGNVSINTYLDIALALGLKIEIGTDKISSTKRRRSPKRFTKEKLKRNQFEVFCIEKYAQHVKKNSRDVYLQLKEEKLLDVIRSDYEDLHGMGIEYLIDFFDSYLEKNVI